MKNYYEILEVNQKASPEIIEKAYKTLVKKYHPDLYSSVQKRDAERKIKEINEAYNILSDSFLRKQYDMELEKEAQEYYYKMQRQQEYSRIQNEPRQEIHQERKKQREPKVVKNKNNVGTLSGIADIIKELFSARPKFDKKKSFSKTDFIALGLTILIMLTLGIILWFIPFTNGFIRQLIPF